MGMAAVDPIGLIGAHPGEDFTAPALHPTDAAGIGCGGIEGCVNSALRQLREDLLLEPQGFPQLTEAHCDPRLHVPVLVRRDVYLEAIVGRYRALHPQVQALSACAACYTNQAQSCGQIGSYLSGIGKAVLKARMLFIDLLQAIDLGHERLRLLLDEEDSPIAVEVARETPRDNDIHEVAVPEALVIGAQHTLL